MKLGIFVTLGLLLLLALSPTGVSSLGSGKVVLALLDLSESTNTTDIRSKYLQAFSAILDQTTHGDTFVVALITEKSVAELSIPVREIFPEFVSKYEMEPYRTAERDLANNKLNDRKKALLHEAEALLQDKSRRILRTDIMSSLQVAERIFASYLLPRKMLVILSDMLEDSADYNLEREVLSSSRADAILAREKARDRIPVLKNVKVYVVGAAAPNLDQYYNVQHFWLRYFMECGATLLKKDYGSALLTFDE